MLTGNRRAAAASPPPDRSQPREQEGFKPENHLHAVISGGGGAVCDGEVRGDPFRTNEEETPSLTCRERGEKGHSL